MALKCLNYGEQGSWKSCFALSMAAGGPIAIADTEFAYDWYIAPHPSPRPLSNKEWQMVTLREEAKALFGIPLERTPDLYLLQSQELGKVQEFLETFGSVPEIFGLAVDSMSVLWDMASDVAYDLQDANPKLGGLAWEPPKRSMRRFQYALLRSRKHYVVTAHLQQKLNKEMAVIGEGPWTEKKVPHWLDVIIKHEKMAGNKVKLTVEKERSLKRVEKGDVVEPPTFMRVVEMLGGVPPVNEGVVVGEVESVEKANKNTVMRRVNG